MNHLIIGLSVILLAVSANANQSRQKLEDRALRVTQRLQRAIQNNVDSMTRSELKNYIRTTRDAIKIARGTAGSAGLIVRIQMESIQFPIEAFGIDDFKQKCKSKVRSLVRSSVDDISVAISGGKKESIRNNSGYWRDPAVMCDVANYLYVKSAFAGGISVSMKRNVILGMADSIAIVAEGNSLQEIIKSCTDNVNMTGSVDDIAVSLNGGAVKTVRNHSSYWRDASQLCNTAINLVL